MDSYRVDMNNSKVSMRVQLSWMLMRLRLPACVEPFRYFWTKTPLVLIERRVMSKPSLSEELGMRGLLVNLCALGLLYYTLLTN